MIPFHQAIASAPPGLDQLSQSSIQALETSAAFPGCGCRNYTLPRVSLILHSHRRDKNSRHAADNSSKAHVRAQCPGVRQIPGEDCSV